MIRLSPTPSATGSSTTLTCSSWAAHRCGERKPWRLNPNLPDPQVTRRFAPITLKCFGTPAQVQAERALKWTGIRIRALSHVAKFSIARKSIPDACGCALRDRARELQTGAADSGSYQGAPGCEWNQPL